MQYHTGNFARASKVNKPPLKVEKGDGSKFSFNADVNALNANEFEKHSRLPLLCPSPPHPHWPHDAKHMDSEMCALEAKTSEHFMRIGSPIRSIMQTTKTTTS